MVNAIALSDETGSEPANGSVRQLRPSLIETYFLVGQRRFAARCDAVRPSENAELRRIAELLDTQEFRKGKVSKIIRITHELDVAFRRALM